MTHSTATTITRRCGASCLRESRDERPIIDHRKLKWINKKHRELVAKIPRPVIRDVVGKTLTKKSPAVDERDRGYHIIKEDEELLHSAASQGLVDTMEALLAKENISCDLLDRCGRTALHWAAEEGHPGVVHALVGAGACIESRSRYNATPLMLAALEGHVDVVRLLLDARAGAPDRHLDGMPRRCVQWRSTALHYAAAGGHLGVVSLLLRAGFDREQHDGAGLTPVEISARSSHSSAAATRCLLPDDRGGALVHDYVNMATEDEEIIAVWRKVGHFWTGKTVSETRHYTGRLISNTSG